MAKKEKDNDKKTNNNITQEIPYKISAQLHKPHQKLELISGAQEK